MVQKAVLVVQMLPRQVVDYQCYFMLLRDIPSVRTPRF